MTYSIVVTILLIITLTLLINTIRNSLRSEERLGRKLNKTKRGGGVKGSFRNAKGDSVVNQEKYFVGA